MKNKTGFLNILPASFFFIALSGFMCNEKKGSRAMIHSATSEQKGFAVIELFTSEGCSSCPPADAAVARLLAQKNENIFVLGFHVDYWDRLGWKDHFSETQFSNRQRQYAKSLSLESIYTPQVVVNGTSEFVGSDEKRLTMVVNKALVAQTVTDLKVEAVRKDDTIMIAYETTEKNVVINAALVLPETTTEVKRGENGGRSLHHVNVVRVFRTSNADAKGTLELIVPKGLSEKALQVIVYIQQKDTRAILAAGQQSI